MHAKHQRKAIRDGKMVKISRKGKQEWDAGTLMVLDREGVWSSEKENSC